MDYSFRIGGEAGQGVQTIGDTLSKVFSRLGYHVFTHQDYESRIRGGHNYYQLRIADRPISASRSVLDIIVAFDRESIERYGSALSATGRFLYDAASLKDKFDGVQFTDIPFAELALNHGGSKIMANTVAVGSVLGFLGPGMEILIGIIDETFKKKGADIIRQNTAAARAGYEYAGKVCNGCTFPVTPPGDPKMLISGTEAIGFGAVASGCKFYAAYPMTPSTGVMNYIAGKEKEFGIVVEQAEDEIAAINMAIGASFGGVRSMTASSGGGFALMTEGVSLAGITETPLVIGLAQRPGPATGLPTRTEQGELGFLLTAGHGEFPRVIYAPGNPEEAVYLTNRAFELAEKYQIPAFILFDQYLGDTQWTYDRIDLSRLEYNDYRLRGDELESRDSYSRYLLTDTGVSPLAVPGASRHLVVADSDEHDQDGHIIEDAATRRSMVEKRLHKKLHHLRQEIRPPLYYGADDPELVLVGWGSTSGIIREAVDELSVSRSVGMLHFSELWPFPLSDGGAFVRILNNAQTTICIENNATGQFASLLRTETGHSCSRRINRYDGRPFMREELLREIYANIE